MAPSSDELKATAKEYDFAFLVDDSILVRPVVWDSIKEAVSSLADMAYKIASTNFTISFVNDRKVLKNLRNKEDVLRDMGNVTPQGRANFAMVLNRLLDRKLTTYEGLTDDELASEQKMIVIVVLSVSFSDQVKTVLDSVLTRTETRLRVKAIPEEYLGVQFLYFERVPALESDLQEIHDDHEEISDYTQFTTAPSENLMWKILLGAVNLGVREDDFEIDGPGNGTDPSSNDPNIIAPPLYTPGATSNNAPAGLVFLHDPRVIGGLTPSQDLDINFSISSPFTIQFWIQLGTDYGGQFVSGDVGNTKIFGIYGFGPTSTYPSSVRADFHGQNGAIYLATTQNGFVLNPNWTLLTLIYPGNSSKYELYMDGILVASNDGRFPVNWRPWKASYMKLAYTGVNYANGGSWRGAIEQFQMYSQALTEEEIFRAVARTAPK